MSLAIPLIALALLAVGVVNEPQNAYAGFEEPHCSEGDTARKAPPVVTSIVPTIDGVTIEWTQAELDADRRSGSHIGCFYPLFFEVEVDDATPVNSPFIFEDEEIAGGDGGEYTVEGLECGTEYALDVDAIWRSGSFGGRHIDGADHEFTTLACEPEIDHGQVVEVHCEVEYDWYQLFFSGEREGEGECSYVYEDDFEQHVDVEVSGGFVLGFGDPIPISGTFNIEDEDENAIYTDEEGFLEDTDCSEDFCLESDLTVTGGDGIFDDLGGEGEREATIFIETQFFIYTDGYAFSTIWIFFDCEECEEESEGGSDGPENAERPSIGELKTGQRVVTGGLTVNGVTIDADYWATEFPQINVDLNKPITFKFVIYDDRKDNIKHLQLQLGKGHIGESFSQIGSATWDRNVMTKVATVTHDDMFKDVAMWRAPDVDCMVGSTECTVIIVEVTPTRAIVDNIVFGVNIWDDNGNAVQTFFNDGIQIGTEADIVVEEPIDTTVYKKQLRTDGGLGNIDKRYSEAFQMKHDWHNANIDKLVDELGY